jgi:hypothetical protein
MRNACHHHALGNGAIGAKRENIQVSSETTLTLIEAEVAALIYVLERPFPGETIDDDPQASEVEKECRLAAFEAGMSKLRETLAFSVMGEHLDAITGSLDRIEQTLADILGKLTSLE